MDVDEGKLRGERGLLQENYKLDKSTNRLHTSVYAGPYMQAQRGYMMVSSLCKCLGSIPAWILSKPGLDLA